MRSLSASRAPLPAFVLSVLAMLPPAGLLADGVPTLDVAQSCRAAQAIGGDDKNLAYKGCMQDEKEARDQLAQKWAKFKPADRRDCVAQGVAPMPSYVEILTCLEMFDGASTFQRPAGEIPRALGGRAPAAQSHPLPAVEPPSASAPSPPPEAGAPPPP